MTILPAPPRGWKRPSMSVQVRLQVLLNQAGICAETGARLQTVSDCRFDHRPALWEREFDTVAGDTIPAANDPAHIQAVSVKGHDIRTHGAGGEKRITTANSDSHRRAHGRAMTVEHQAFQRRMLARTFGEEEEPAPEKAEKRKHRWPKRKMEARPFERRQS